MPRLINHLNIKTIMGKVVNSEVHHVSRFETFTDLKKNELAHEIVKAQEEAQSAIEEKKAVMSRQNSIVKARELVRDDLISKLNRGGDDVNYECHADPDYDKGLMIFTDVLTGEVIKRRELFPEEKQGKLFDMRTGTED